jgi:hypothetical protein
VIPVDMAGKLAVEAFILADEVVGLADAWHLSFGSKQKDSTEATKEEDSFDGAECDTPFSEARVFGIEPLQGPFRFSLDTWQCVQGIK